MILTIKMNKKHSMLTAGAQTRGSIQLHILCT